MKIAISALFVFSTLLANAQWQSTSSPNAGGVNCFVKNGNNLFAGTDSVGTIVSANNGISWTTAASGLTNKNVRSLAGSGQDIYAGTNGAGVFLSSDNGSNWSGINTGLGNTNVNALAISGNTIFAGTNAGVFISANKGNTWAEANNGLSKIPVNTIAVSGSNVFAGTYGAGVFLSTDNGNSWTAVNTGLSSDSINSLAINGSDIYAGTYSSGVFVSGDNGSNWTAVNTGLSNTHVWAMVVSGPVVFAGTGGGGKGNGSGGGTGGGKGKGGVFLSRNKGLNWASANTGLPKTDVRSLVINGDYLIAGTSDAKVWKRALSEFTSGIQQANAQNAEMSIYPNPTGNSLHIQYNTTSRQQLVIYNALGEAVYNSSWPMTQTQQTINISSLPKGVYMIRIGEEMRRLVKE